MNLLPALWTTLGIASLVLLADGRVGLLYEARGHRDLEMIRFPVDWLTQLRGDSERSEEEDGDD